LLKNKKNNPKWPKAQADRAGA